MTAPSDFNSGSAAPAPMDLSLLELGGVSDSAAPAPADLVGAGESIDGAPAPAPLDQLEGVAGLGQAPTPMPLDQIGQATVDHIDAPSPTDGPGGDVVEEVEAAQTGAAPEPMAIDQLNELERGR